MVDNKNLNEVKFCKKCVMSNQRPGSTIEFKNTKNEKKSIFLLILLGFVALVNIKSLKILK